jgi:hypothetical protein
VAGSATISGLVHDLNLVQVKTPADSKGPWDLVKLVATIPPDQAFRPLDRSKCNLVGKVIGRYHMIPRVQRAIVIMPARTSG